MKFSNASVENTRELQHEAPRRGCHFESWRVLARMRANMSGTIEAFMGHQIVEDEVFDNRNVAQGPTSLIEAERFEHPQTCMDD